MKLAVLCYVKQAGETLMLHRNREGDFHQGKWNGLGGKFEPGESPEECLRREVKEESGLEVQGARLRGFITFPNFDERDDWYVFLYTVSAFTGELRASDEGELHWIDDDDLLSLNLWAGDRVFLPWLDRERMFSAKFIYEAGQLKDYEVMFY